MPRIAPIAKSETDAGTAATLESVKARTGRVSNAIATLAQAPAALNGYLALSQALIRGRLTTRQREAISLAVAQANACQYCLSVHTLTGGKAGLKPADIRNTRSGKSDEERENAILAFAVKVVEQRGQISDAEFSAAQAAGLDGGLIVEIIANVALNTLTNYTNRIAQTEIDFPAVSVEL